MRYRWYGMYHDQRYHAWRYQQTKTRLAKIVVARSLHG